MTDEVTGPWEGGVDVTEMTDTDIQASRTEGMAVIDPDGYIRRLIETYRRASDLSSQSAVCDRALRVELAHAIDSYDVTFSREDFDLTHSQRDVSEIADTLRVSDNVAYTIPPVGWVGDHEDDWEEVEILSEDEVELGDRRVSFTTAPVVHDMAKEATELGEYRLIKDVLIAGLERLLGQR